MTNTVLVEKRELTQDQRDNLIRWAEALESGEYEQGSGKLRSPDGTHCCLGVAAVTAPDEVLAEAGGVQRIRRGVLWLQTGAELTSSYLTEQLADLHGLSRPTQKRIGSLNDSGQIDFPGIAARVREYAATGELHLPAGLVVFNPPVAYL